MDVLPIPSSIPARLKGLRQEKAELADRADAIMKAGGKQLSSEQQRDVDTMLARMRGINSETDELERVLEDDRNAPSPRSMSHAPRQSAAGPEGRRFTDLFPSVQLSADGWRDAEEFLAAIDSGRAEPRLKYLPGPRL